MSDNIFPFTRPINWERLRTDEAERVIRERARVSSRVKISAHARQRLNERGDVGVIVTVQDVLNILLTGVVAESPVRDGDKWKVKVEKRVKETRDIGVVTLILEADDRVFVKTIEWEDV